MTMEDIIRIIFGVAMIIAAVGVLAIGIYNGFLAPDVSKSKKWAKTTAKVIDRHLYQKIPRPSVTRAKPQYVDCYEKIISYTVNGKEYKKTLPDEYEGEFVIYYKTANPAHFFTEEEVKDKGNGKNIGIFIFCTVVSLVLIILSVMNFNS